jgi:hypothetical protein
MVDQRVPARRSRGLMAPVLGGLALIGALVAGIAFRSQVWQAIQWAGRQIQHWFTEWIPAHPGQTGAIAGFAVVAFLLNWIAHVRGRLRAWIFAIVVEAGLWAIFWYGAWVIPSLNQLFGLRIDRMDPMTAVISGAYVVGITGAIFWFLEMREEWRKYRRRHHVDDD